MNPVRKKSSANSEKLRYWTKMVTPSVVQRDGNQRRKRRNTALSLAERLTAKASSLTKMVSAIMSPTKFWIIQC